MSFEWIRSCLENLFTGRRFRAGGRARRQARRESRRIAFQLMSGNVLGLERGVDGQGSMPAGVESPQIAVDEDASEPTR